MIDKYDMFNEINKSKPKTGDYVVIFDIFHGDVLPYTNNQVGIIVSQSHSKNGYEIYRIKYDNIPKSLIKRYSSGDSNEDFLLTPTINHSTLVKHGFWSKDKDELELIIKARKYKL
jgi:hypothetical protein